MVTRAGMQSAGIVLQCFCSCSPQPHAVRRPASWLLIAAASGNDSLKRKRKLCEWPCGQSQQCVFTVVRAYPVKLEHSATCTAVDNAPLPVWLNVDADGFHDGAASGTTVARTQINVAAAEAVRTVVAVMCTGMGRSNSTPTVSADEGFV